MTDRHAVSMQITQSPGNRDQKRWRALFIVCLATLMIVIDTTIINVALPSIKLELGFNDASLAWVINVYLLLFGGFLLLGGRLGDLYGQRTVFMWGVILFTLASLACGTAATQATLIAARGLQGFGGALVAATALSLIVHLFPQPIERTKAIAANSFVCAGGGSIGVLLGGILTDVYDWHSIFLVNLPLGLIVIALAYKYLPPAATASSASLDISGAITITSALLVAVYTIMNGNEVGWLSKQTLLMLAVAALLFILFLAIEVRRAEPLVPLRLFRLRNLSTANVVGLLWATSMFAWFFLGALYLQQVLRYTPLEVGLAFLPANLAMAVCSLSVSPRLILRYGTKVPLVGGLALAAIGLFLLSFAPVNGGFVADVLPGMLLLGLGSGVAFNPILVAAMGDVAPCESGLASGIVNTSFMMGGALGLALISSLVASRRDYLAGTGVEPMEALSGGYGAALLAGALLTLIASLTSAVLLRKA
jgi:EmrB/QacA subfamily drug resistance transporter